MKSRLVNANKRGRPVAILQPVKKKSWKSPKGAWIGKVKIVGDIVEFDTTHLWHALRNG
jgi:hypothetical protein